MVLLHNQPTKLAIITGKYVMSSADGCTDVIGGTMTAGSLTAAQGSALLTWAPPFVSAPMIFGTVNKSNPAATTNATVRFTGVTVSNAYVMMAAGNNACSQAVIGITVIGEARL